MADGGGLFSTAVARLWRVAQESTLQRLYGWLLWSAGLGCVLTPQVFLTSNSRALASHFDDNARILGVWLMCSGTVIESACGGRAVPHYVPPLYFLMSTLVTVRRGLTQDWTARPLPICVALVHFAALLLQTRDKRAAIQ